jgi:hypothetical protein
MDIELKEVHVGKEIKKRLFELGMKKSDFGKKSGIAQQHVARVFERETMETQKLMRVCKTLDLNIFAMFCSFPPEVQAYIDGSDEAELPMTVDDYKDQVANLEKDVLLLKDQIETLKQLVAAKDHIINLYQQQNQ